eukprot:TRINITY_DN12107_c0_g1_i1.p1 TRINITY_DN12107_c0_g1~~TRINITY_DN12107_c0_g1_i1.p1  ORF type:complete len:1328 (-),score=178.65 TRINITY_DN12107_c0_g1_i1:97-4080(-)
MTWAIGIQVVVALRAFSTVRAIPNTPRDVRVVDADGYVRRSTLMRRQMVDPSKPSSKDAEVVESPPPKNHMPLEFDVLGPFPRVDGGADVLNAFGGIWEAYAIWASINGSETRSMRGSLAEEDLADVLNVDDESGLGRTAYPSEIAPGGLATWSILKVNHSLSDRGFIPLNFSKLLKEAGRPADGMPSWRERESFGWAVGTFNLNASVVFLARCSTPFFLDQGEIMNTPDVYGEHRAISVLNLRPGKHTLAVMAPDGGFGCELFEDAPGERGQQARKNITETDDGSNGSSPLVLLSDAQMSDVVGGRLASNYLSVPVLNTLKVPLALEKVELVGAPSGLALKFADGTPIAPGQQKPLRMELEEMDANDELTCYHDGVFNITLRLTPTKGVAQERTLASRCAGKLEGSGGYVVTYPDFDATIQRAFVAPPNLAKAEGQTCPEGGCPILLSLHGAAVRVDDLGARTFGYGNRSFPYAAWLVMPTNRWHWGTDWEGQGLDNALAAVKYVKANLPGLPRSNQIASNNTNATEVLKRSERDRKSADSGTEAVSTTAPAAGSINILTAGARPSAERSSTAGFASQNRTLRERYAVHPARILLHGHSMGGHGCYVLGAHFPDGLMGMACAAGWSSSISSHARLLDGTREGIRHATLAEHSADLLAANLFGVPFLITYGDSDDNVPPDEPRYMARLVRSFSKQGSAVVLREERNTSHWFTQSTPALHAFFRHVLHGEGPPIEALKAAVRAAKYVDSTGEAKAAEVAATKARAEAAAADERARLAKKKWTQARDAEASTEIIDYHKSGVSGLLQVSANGVISADAVFPRKSRSAESHETVGVLGVRSFFAEKGEDMPLPAGPPVRENEGIEAATAAATQALAAGPQASSKPRNLPDLPLYFEFKVTNVATFGTRGNLQLLQLDVPHAPGKILVSRRATDNNSTNATDSSSQELLASKHREYVRELNPVHTSADVWVLRTYNVRRFRIKQPGVPGIPLPRVLLVDGTRFSGDELGGPHTGVHGRHFCRHEAVRRGTEDGFIGDGGVHAPSRRKWRVCDEISWTRLERGTPLQGGPLQMVIRREPVCIVHQGSIQGSEKLAVSLANRMYFVSRYSPVVFNGNVENPEDSFYAATCAKRSNLILIGGAVHNAWARRLACAVRYVQFLRFGGFVVGGERYIAPRTGLLALGAQTFTAKRVLLVAGTDEKGLATATRNVPVASGQLNTDFAVYGSRAGWAGAGGILASGFVDTHWQIPTDTLSSAFVEPEPPYSQFVDGDGTATLLEHISSWGMAPEARNDEFLLDENECAADQANADLADDEMQAGRSDHGDDGVPTTTG